MDLRSFPFYPGLVGQPIPGTDRKTTIKHSLFMGVVINLSNKREQWCFASTKYLADLLELSEHKVCEHRGDLVRLGWLECEHGDRNKVTKMWSLLNIGTVSRYKNEPTEGGSCAENVPTETPVTTPVGNKNLLNKNLFPPVVKNTTVKSTESLTPAASPSAETSSLTEHPKGDEGGRCKNYNTQDDPFASDVKNVSPAKQKADPKFLRTKELADELASMFVPGTVSGANLRAVVQARLREGVLPEQLRMAIRFAKTDEYFCGFPPAALLGENMFAGVLNKATKKKRDDHPSWRGLSPY